MKKTTILLLVLIAILIAGCSNAQQADPNNSLSIQGSGNIVSKQLDFTNFASVETGMSFGLTIRHGMDFNVTLSADDNFIDYILVEQDGTTLILGYQPGYAYNVRGVTMHLDVTMPDLAGLSMTGSSHTWLEGAVSKETFDAELSGSSMLEGELLAADAHFDLSGSTYLILTGSAGQMRVDSCGNSVANLEKFQVEDAVIMASCNSITSVNVVGNLEVDASQYAQVFYTGKPAVINNDVFESAFVEGK